MRNKKSKNSENVFKNKNIPEGGDWERDDRGRGRKLNNEFL